MLGQVKYVFTDKTGTMTKNKLTFRKFSVPGGQTFGVDPTSKWKLKNLLTEGPQGEASLQVRHMLVGMSLCHTVIVQQGDQGKKKRVIIGKG